MLNFLKTAAENIPTVLFGRVILFVATDGQPYYKDDAGVVHAMAGTDGKSAYQLWLDAGNTGTEAQFLASLKGAGVPAGGSAGLFLQKTSNADYATQWTAAMDLTTAQTVGGAKTFSAAALFNETLTMGPNKRLLLSRAAGDPGTAASIRGGGTGEFVLSAGGAPIFLRPGGDTVTVNQITVGIDGSMLWTGNAASKLATRQSLGVGTAGEQTTEYFQRQATSTEADNLAPDALTMVAWGSNGVLEDGYLIASAVSRYSNKPTFSVVAGDILDISMDVRPNAATSYSRVNVRFDGPSLTNSVQPVQLRSDPAVGQWQSYGGTITAPAGATIARIQIESSAEGISQSVRLPRIYRRRPSVMHLSGAETASGAKTFSALASFNAGTRHSTDQILGWGAAAGSVLGGARVSAAGAMILFGTSAAAGPSIYWRPTGNLLTAGQLILNADGSLTFFDETAKDKTRRDLGLPITVSATAPLNPQVGDVWLDIS